MTAVAQYAQGAIERLWLIGTAAADREHTLNFKHIKLTLTQHKVAFAIA